MTRRLAEVAQKVGVSEATVSRVLNGKPGVSDATRAAVLTALDVLGYERPTQLRGQRSRLVGLVLPELQNPIFPAFADVVGNGLAQRGFTPVLCTRTAGGVSEADYVELLLQQHVSGVVFAGGLFAQADASHEHYRRLTERGLPAVLVNAAVSDLRFPKVSCDDAVAAEQALGHLLSLGHERVGMVLGPHDHVPSQRKLAAFLTGAARAGVVVPEHAVEHVMFSLEGGQAAATRLLRNEITGIVCASDPLALGAIRAVRRAGLRVPEDVSVVGFDDSAFMNCTDPPLTTVRQPIEAMGRAAVDLLVSQIDGGPASTEELLFEPELVVRGSTAPASRL
ncbi:DNA-binding LacI/PurR family transcriptional regulator [Kutzneria viridogrisea]|nr:LacI family DNA-binding transcriptional regulator [Kutzneria albida]MBA8928554.1 DNA-binding LacI/PurR family transcriptional regulator [Kutzneria viridogrisea]